MVLKENECKQAQADRFVKLVNKYKHIDSEAAAEYEALLPLEILRLSWVLVQ